MINIAIDAMGGDSGSSVVTAAIKKLCIDYPELSFTVFGDASELKSIVGICTVVATTQVMSMEDGALAIRRKSDSSMVKAIESVRDGSTQGIVSCGSTGALLAGSLLLLKTFETLERPALMLTYPSVYQTGTDILDIGSNAENTSTQLLQFAKMGNAFAKNVRNIENPRVALLNIGSEDKKGDTVHKETFDLINQQKDINFIGNIEGRDLLMGVADVIITDGFSGNIALKTMEGTAAAYQILLKDVFNTNLFNKLAALVIAKELRIAKGHLDYRKYGGAVLAGINYPVIKAHGSSDSEAFYNAVLQCKKLIDTSAIDKMKKDIV